MRFFWQKKRRTLPPEFCVTLDGTIWLMLVGPNSVSWLVVGRMYKEGR